MTTQTFSRPALLICLAFDPRDLHYRGHNNNNSIIVISKKHNLLGGGYSKGGDGEDTSNNSSINSKVRPVGIYELAADYNMKKSSQRDANTALWL